LSKEGGVAQSDLIVRIDDDLKASGEELLRRQGMNWSTAFSAFISYSVKMGEIPVEASLHEPNAETLEAMEEVEQMIKNPSIGKSYTNVHEMMKALLA
jgi:DNA-damage-inducible protein J